jgi:single-strand DNA-binding protein
MSGVNKVILLGRLGQDPDIRTTDAGIKVAQMSIATSETFKDKTTGEKKEITEWHRVVMWRGLAEVAEKFLKKGDMIYVEGKLVTRSWENKEGVKQYTTEVVAKEMTMLSTKGGHGVPTPSEADHGIQEAEVITDGDETDDPPF